MKTLKNKIRTYKGKNAIQYGRGDMTICVMSAAFRKSIPIERKYESLFIGGAYGSITREFAAGILKQWRKGGGE